jgi:hypothetical protein
VSRSGFYQCLVVVCGAAIAMTLLAALALASFGRRYQHPYLGTG